MLYIDNVEHRQSGFQQPQHQRIKDNHNEDLQSDSKTHKYKLFQLLAILM